MRARLLLKSRGFLGVGLLSAAIMAVLLQLGPADASPQRHVIRTKAQPTKQRALNAYNKLPLAFTPNAGQIDTRVRYYGQGAGFSVFLTGREAAITLQRSGRRGGRKGTALALRFLGANRSVLIRGERLARGRVNYLVGIDPAKWRTGLRTYERVVYHDLWPGVDMIFTGRQGKLKYEFLVRPSGRVGDIKLAYRGADRLALDRAGNLRIRTSLGILTDTRPASYQLVAGRRVPVASSFALGGSDYGFALSRAYDRRYPLVIDPGLVYSTYLGGSMTDGGRAVAVDSNGDAYVTGTSDSPDFPTTIGAFDTTTNGSNDVFMTKLDAPGSGLVYSTYLGGSGYDQGVGIAVDPGGAAYVTGTTTSSDFPTTGGAFDTTANGEVDGFVTKLDAAGSALVYSTYLGGGGGDELYAIALDGTGSAYVTGGVGAGFPTTSNAFDTTFNGAFYDAVVTKLDPAGSSLVYSTYLGGISNEFGRGIAVDAGGSAYVAGNSASPDFPTTRKAFDRTSNGGDAIVTKLNAAGSRLVYSTYLGGSADDTSSGVALDSAGSAYVIGGTYSSDFPTTIGSFDTTFNGVFDAVVTKLDATGSGLVYSTYLGGSSSDVGEEIGLDGTGSAYVTGGTGSSDFPTTSDALDTTLDGGIDAIVTKLDATGTGLIYSTYLGGSGGDYAYGIAVDAGNGYVTGDTPSVDFPTTAGAFDTTYNGDFGDAFMTKLELGGGPPPPPPLTCDSFADTSPTCQLENTGTTMGTNLTATGEAGEPDHGGVSIPLNSVWYAFTATTTGTVKLDTCGGTNFDTTLAAYTGDSVDALTQVAANDDACGTHSRISFTALAGTTYHVALDGKGVAVGSFALSFRVG